MVSIVLVLLLLFFLLETLGGCLYGDPAVVVVCVAGPLSDEFHCNNAGTRSLVHLV